MGIPGLLFKKDIQRRNSKKKRKSQVFDESTESGTKRVNETDKTLEVLPLKEPIFHSKNDLSGDGFVEVKLLENDKVEIEKTSSSRNSTLKRRHSKKKRESVEK